MSRSPGWRRRSRHEHPPHPLNHRPHRGRRVRGADRQPRHRLGQRARDHDGGVGRKCPDRSGERQSGCPRRARRSPRSLSSPSRECVLLDRLVRLMRGVGRVAASGTRDEISRHGLPIATNTVGEFVLGVWKPRIHLLSVPHLAQFPAKGFQTPTFRGPGFHSKKWVSPVYAWCLFVSGTRDFGGQSARAVGRNLRNARTRHERDYERTYGWGSSAILRIGSSILTLVSGQVRLSSRPPGCL